MKRAGIAVIFELRDLIAPPGVQTTVKKWTGPSSYREAWVRAVPEPFYDGILARFRSAWEVLCGRAYPVAWPKAGELEAALEPHSDR